MLKEYDVKVTLSKIVIVTVLAENEREAEIKAGEKVRDPESETIEDAEVIEEREYKEV